MKAQEASGKLVTCTAPQTKEKSSKIIQMEIPENSQELTYYTQQKINKLISNNEICIPEIKIKFCSNCRHETHNVSECKELEKKISAKVQKKNDKSCIMCGSDHEMITCGYIQALDVAHSFTVKNRQRLFKLCSYLQEVVDRPRDYILYSFTWL